MNRKLILKFSAACFATIILGFVSCQDKDYYDPEYLPESGGSPSDVNFSTSQSVKLDFKNLMAEGLITVFNVYAENPYENTNIQPIASGINVAGVSNLNRALPKYVDELYVTPTTLFAPSLMYAKVENGIANFVEISTNKDASNSEIETRSYGTKSVDHYLSTYLSRINIGGSGGWFGEDPVYRYKPTIALKTDEPFPVAVKNAIAKAFPNKIKAEAKYYKDASIKIVQEEEVDEGAELWLSVIHSEGDYNNSLMYFCYNGDKELSELTESEKANLHLISAFQFAKLDHLKDGQYIKLKYFDGNKYLDKFPINTKIGWVLSSNGFREGDYYWGQGYRSTTRNNSTNYPWFYSIPSWNPEKNNKNHTISYTATHNNKDYICFGFEDMSNDEGDGDCNDVMFHIIANPIKALIPPPYIPEEGTFESTDIKTGILAFEDNWPRLGDYDLNDVVVKYTSEITDVQKTEDGVPVGNVTMKRIIDKISIINDGATFDNAFSYKIGFPLSIVESVKVDGEDYAPVDEGDGFIIDLCMNVKNITLPKEYTVQINFKEGAIKSDDFNDIKKYPYAKAPYNPFIQPTNPTINSNGIEVHLPFYPPTKRADMNLFGKFADTSDKTKEIYYAAPEGNYYPFALNLVEVKDFVIPQEGKSIDKTYSKYLDWVNSGCGTDNADWYLHPNP